MTVILLKYKRDINQTEIDNRINYINSVFHDFVRVGKETDTYVTLKSLLDDSSSILYIVGHNIAVYEYIESNKKNIKEKTIIIVSCFAFNIKRVSNLLDKDIYISKNINGITINYAPEEYGLGFEISDSEICLYNIKDKNIYDKIKECFIEITNYKEECYGRINKKT